MTSHELRRCMDHDHSLATELDASRYGAPIGEDERVWVWGSIRVRGTTIGLALELIDLEPDRALLVIPSHEPALVSLLGREVWLPRFGASDWSPEHGISPLPEAEDAVRWSIPEASAQA